MEKRKTGVEIKVNVDTTEAEEKLLNIKNMLLDIEKILESIDEKYKTQR